MLCVRTRSMEVNGEMKWRHCVGRSFRRRFLLLLFALLFHLFFLRLSQELFLLTESCALGAPLKRISSTEHKTNEEVLRKVEENRSLTIDGYNQNKTEELRGNIQICSHLHHAEPGGPGLQRGLPFGMEWSSIGSPVSS